MNAPYGLRQWTVNIKGDGEAEQIHRKTQLVIKIFWPTVSDSICVFLILICEFKTFSFAQPNAILVFNNGVREDSVQIRFRR